MDRFKKYLPFLIIAVGVLAYANSFSNPFIFDDETVIRKSVGIYHTIPLPLRSRFVVYLTFKFNHLLGGWNVADYHAVNILIHILAGLLLYGIIKSTFLLPRLSSRYGKAAPYLAAVCASLWVAHPLQTESVTYICQRFESMMGMFFFLSLYCFIRGVDSKHKRFWYDASIAACAVGMGTKEVMISAPVMILLYDYVFVSGSFRRLFVSRWKVHSALFCTLGIRAVLQVFSFVSSHKAGMALVSEISPVTYLFTQFGVIIHYLRLSIFPYPLCLDYGWPPAERLNEILLPAICLNALGLVTLWALWRRLSAGFLGAWFFIILSPTSSIIPVGDIAFEHRMYLPLAAVIVLLVTGIDQLLNYIFRQANMGGKTKAWTRIAIAGLVLVVFGGLTVLRNTDYRSEESMWRDVLAKRSHNYRAHISLIASLLAEAKFAEAEIEARQFIERISCATSPGTTRYIFSPEITSFYFKEACNQLGRSLLAQGKTEEAIKHFREAIRRGPDHEIFYYNLALALVRIGRLNEAMSACESAIAIAPDYGKPHAMAALIFVKRGEFSEAIEHYRKALELEPDLLPAKIDLAWLLATCPEKHLRDGTTAVKLAASVCDATEYKSVRALDVLAAAYAEDGKFDEAVRTAREALKLASEKSRKKYDSMRNEKDAAFSVQTSEDSDLLMDDIKKHIELYTNGEPFRNER